MNGIIFKLIAIKNAIVNFFPHITIISTKEKAWKNIGK